MRIVLNHAPTEYVLGYGVSSKSVPGRHRPVLVSPTVHSRNEDREVDIWAHDVSLNRRTAVGWDCPVRASPTHAPAASAITVPASSSCKLDLAKAVRRSFWPESRLDPSDALTMALEQMDSIEATTTSTVDPFLNE